MNLNLKYYCRIAISALLILISDFYQNTGFQMPYYVFTFTYLLIVVLVPLALWMYNKDKKKIAELDNQQDAQRLFDKITMKKMTLVHVPSGLSAILFLIQPIDSLLYASIVSLLLFVVFGKPGNINDID